VTAERTIIRHGRDALHAYETQLSHYVAKRAQ